MRKPTALASLTLLIITSLIITLLIITSLIIHSFINICNCPKGVLCCTSPRPCFSLAYNYHQMFSTVFYVILLIYILLYNLFILHAHFTRLLALLLIVAFVIYFSRYFFYYICFLNALYTNHLYPFFADYSLSYNAVICDMYNNTVLFISLVYYNSCFSSLWFIIT